MGQKLIDETGNKYGFLTVKELTKDKNGRTAWLCECDCGNTKIVRGSDLRSGKITSCGRDCALRYQRSGVIKNEIGHQYGRLTVIARAGIDKYGKVKWRCRCECGNECDVVGSDLRSGKQVSCGCWKNEQASNLQFKDETGNTYGYLTVLSLVTKHPKAIWKCQCKCGNIIDVKGIDLRRGNTKSCGCLLSWKEEEIVQILNKNNLTFGRQITYDTLRSNQGYKLRFDFGFININTNKIIGLIEYQGRQHTTSIDTWGGEEGLKQRQDNDNKKIQFCQINNIPLLILDKDNNLEEDIISFYNTLPKE